MPEDQSRHPSEDELREFISGRLDEYRSSKIEEHLSSCQACNKILEGQAPEDEFVQLVRDAHEDKTNAQHDLTRTDETVAYLSAGPVSSADDVPPHEKPSSQIGPYKLLQTLGEGGMGVVYLAQQEEPVRRKVAVKVIKAGMGSREIIARFEAERQALALMNHPSIAKVLDAGTTETGSPYFVMELVKGVPITQYCDENKLAPRERLELFIAVCNAVQHAHQKGIIHRDIKPSNVMVCNYDGKPVPKVIDFGIAKAVEQDLTDKTMFTMVGHVMGTLEYMSPEQAEVNQLDVDTRSDVYSLGVLLYELLTGSTPITEQQLRNAGYVEMLRTIREHEPPKPSTRLNDSSDAMLSISAVRKTKPAHLSKLVRGDLDWIVMQALEKERERRYESASAFAADIGRFLNDEPVVACPPSAGYRLRKFVRRNKTLFATASVIAVILVTSSIVSTSFAFWALDQQKIAEHERDQKEKARETAELNATEARKAEQAERVARSEEQAQRKLAEASAVAEKEAREEETTQRQLAEEERRVATNVAKYLVDIFRAPDPSQNSRHIKMVSVLDACARRLQGQFDDSPKIKAQLLDAFGKSYAGLGMYEKAVPLHEQSLSMRTEALGKDHRDTLTSMNNLATAYRATGKLNESLDLLKEAVERKKRTLGESHRDTILSICELAECYKLARELETSIAMYENVLRLSQDHLGEKHPQTLVTMSNLGAAYLLVPDTDKAIDILEKAFQLTRQVRGVHHPDTIAALQNLAQAYGNGGKTTAAIKAYDVVIKQFKILLGDKHPKTIGAMNNLAACYLKTEQYGKATQFFEEAAARLIELYGTSHPDALTVISNLAFTYDKDGKTEKGSKLLKATMDKHKPGLKQMPPNSVRAMFALAIIYGRLAGKEKAEPYAKEMFQQMLKVFGEDHPDIIEAKEHMAHLGET